MRQQVPRQQLGISLFSENETNQDLITDEIKPRFLYLQVLSVLKAQRKAQILINRIFTSYFNKKYMYYFLH